MIINRGMNSPDIGGGGLRILQRYIFRGLSFFEILEGAIFKGAASPRGGPGTFWSISYDINN